MNESVLAVANAVLYEGYSLYPYRLTALKNQQRWHFGVLYPPSFCARTQANDAASMQSEVLVADVRPDAHASVLLRFLSLNSEGAEAREIVLECGSFLECASTPCVRDFELSNGGNNPIEGHLEVRATELERSIWKLAVRVENASTFDGDARDAALLRSMISTHLVMTVERARFVSAIDPPAALKEIAAGCKNAGLWPVLMDDGASTMLAAPFILSDHPQVAERSAGDHFDCTEIDEMLALRILTLTDSEKDQMRRDERTRAMLERTEALDVAHLAGLHGPMFPAARVMAEPVAGQRVRLKPRRRADIFDIVLDGKIAVVEAVERDFENRVHVAVTIEDDPGRDLGQSGQPGHRFFFDLDEVEPI